MTDTTTAIPTVLSEIMEDFRLATDQEKLEMLLEYSDSLPELPERLEALKDEMVMVEECQAPVAMHVEPEGDRLAYFIAVPESAPTVRGFASILLEGTSESTPEEILQIPTDFYVEMDLHKVLSPQRMHGISALLVYMKRLTVQRLEAQVAQN